MFPSIILKKNTQTNSFQKNPRGNEEDLKIQKHEVHWIALGASKLLPK